MGRRWIVSIPSSQIFGCLLDLLLFFQHHIFCRFLYIVAQFCMSQGTHWLSKLLVLTWASNRWPFHRCCYGHASSLSVSYPFRAQRLSFFNSGFDDLSRSVAAWSPLTNFFTSRTFRWIVLLLQMYLNIVHWIHSFTEYNKGMVDVLDICLCLSILTYCIFFFFYC